MGPMSMLDLQNLLSQIQRRSLKLEPPYGQYDMPPNWAFRKFPGMGQHPAISRMNEAAMPTEGDRAVQQVLQSLKDPEKQDAFLKWYLNQQSISRMNFPIGPYTYKDRI